MTRRDFSGRTVLITGAAGGLGAACARQFAERGADVVLVGRHRDTLQPVAGATGGTAIEADVTQPADCQRLVAECIRQNGRLDVLVNNAGCHRRGAFDTIDTDDIAAMTDTNLRAPLILTRLALPHLQAVPRGAIVNVASLAGVMPTPGGATYSATKFALRTFTHALAGELRGTSVHASVVSPGPIETPFILEHIDHVTDLTFSQPMSTPDEIARLITVCALDGRMERSRPALSAAMAMAGYLCPPLPRLLKPLLARRGRRNKRRYCDHSNAADP